MYARAFPKAFHDSRPELVHYPLKGDLRGLQSSIERTHNIRLRQAHFLLLDLRLPKVMYFSGLPAPFFGQMSVRPNHDIIRVTVERTEMAIPCLITIVSFCDVVVTITVPAEEE
jgi:hypothetical protein